MSADERLVEIEARATAATDGPWFRNYNDIVPSASDDDDFCDTRIMRGRHGEPRGDKQAMADADFAAHAREDVPWLLALVRELQAENEQLRERVEHRLCYSDECGEPCQSWQAQYLAENSVLREKNGLIGQRLGKARKERDAARAELQAMRDRVRQFADRWEQGYVTSDGLRAAVDPPTTPNAHEGHPHWGPNQERK